MTSNIVSIASCPGWSKGLPRQLIALVEQPLDETPPYLAAVIAEHRIAVDDRITLRVLALAVPTEGFVEPSEQRGMTVAQPIVRRKHARNAARSPLVCRSQDEKPDMGGRKIEPVVRMPGELLASEITADAGADPGAGVQYVVEQPPVEGLRHRPGDHGAEQPVDLRELHLVESVRREAVENGEPDAVVEHVADPGHEAAAGIERVVARVERGRLHGMAAKGQDQLLDLGERGGRDRHPPVALGNVLPLPDPGARSTVPGR